MTPKYAYVLTPRAWECVALYGKRTLQMCFSILRWEDYFALSRWALVITRVLMDEIGRQASQRKIQR
jgi:hypothetical protein